MADPWPQPFSGGASFLGWELTQVGSLCLNVVQMVTSGMELWLRETAFPALVMPWVLTHYRNKQQFQKNQEKQLLKESKAGGAQGQVSVDKC